MKQRPQLPGLAGSISWLVQHDKLEEPAEAAAPEHRLRRKATYW